MWLENAAPPYLYSGAAANARVAMLSEWPEQPSITWHEVKTTLHTPSSKRCVEGGFRQAQSTRITRRIRELWRRRFILAAVASNAAA